MIYPSIRWFTRAAAYFVMVLLLVSCDRSGQKAAVDHSPRRTVKTPSAESGSEKSDSLLYQSKTLSSYIDMTRRGTGVVSFELAINDRLDIWNLDDTKFGEIVLNEDLSFFTINMPRKVVARQLIPEYDFASFDFDAENVNTDPRYLIIYVNNEKRRVEKSAVKFTFRSHSAYLAWRSGK